VCDGQKKSRLFALAACREASGYADIVSYSFGNVKSNIGLSDTAYAVLGVVSPQQVAGVSFAGRRVWRCQGDWQEPSATDPIHDETGRPGRLPVPVTPRSCGEALVCIHSCFLHARQDACPRVALGVAR
jgi:hypothetical protein